MKSFWIWSFLLKYFEDSQVLHSKTDDALSAHFCFWHPTSVWLRQQGLSFSLIPACSVLLDDFPAHSTGFSGLPFVRIAFVQLGFFTFSLAVCRHPMHCYLCHQTEEATRMSSDMFRTTTQLPENFTFKSPRRKRKHWTYHRDDAFPTPHPVWLACALSELHSGAL